MAGKKNVLAELSMGELVDELKATKQEALNLRFRNATDSWRTPPRSARCASRSPGSTRSSAARKLLPPRQDSDGRSNRNHRSGRTQGA